MNDENLIAYSVRLTQKQIDFLKSQSNASLLIRTLIDDEMRKQDLQNLKKEDENSSLYKIQLLLQEKVKIDRQIEKITENPLFEEAQSQLSRKYRLSEWNHDKTYYLFSFLEDGKLSKDTNEKNIQRLAEEKFKNKPRFQSAIRTMDVFQSAINKLVDEREKIEKQIAEIPVSPDGKLEQEEKTEWDIHSDSSDKDKSKTFTLSKQFKEEPSEEMLRSAFPRIDEATKEERESLEEAFEKAPTNPEEFNKLSVKILNKIAEREREKRKKEVKANV